MKRTALALLAVSALVAAACGPTVHNSTAGSPSAVGGVPGGSLNAPVGGTTTGGTTGGGTSGGGTLGGGGGGSVPTGGGGQLPTGTGGGKHVAAPPAVPGVTDTTIYIGSYYVKNQGAGNAALGVAADQGDARKPQNVMINWVNTHGGVAGRSLKPIYYGFDGSPNGPPSDQQEQSACAKYTQDNHVFAILISGPVIDECAKKAGTVEFGQYGTPSIYQKYPHRIDIDTLNQVRAQQVIIDGLAQLGYWDKGAKIGVITWDQNDYREAITDGLLPALKRHGLSLATDPVYVSVPQTLQDFGAGSAAINNAVLKFSTLGIDHVLINDGPAGIFTGAGLTIEWLKRSESQQYYPRYGFNDSNLPIELRGLSLLSDRQAQRSVYVNWIDFGAAYEEGYHANRNGQLCTKIMRQHGIDMSNTNSKAAALVACNDMWFLQAVGVELSALNLDLTTEAFISAVEHLGYKYLSTLSYLNYFSAQQHDGAAGVRHAKFGDSCKCYKWVGTVYKVG